MACKACYGKAFFFFFFFLSNDVRKITNFRREVNMVNVGFPGFVSSVNGYGSLRMTLAP
jgi:hypothetical protein